MNANEYQALAMRTSNKTLSTRDHILNGVLGLCGEAGEVADSVKKAYMQGHVIDTEHIAEELGDDGRILVRPSGPEPLIRIMIEGKDEKIINDLVYECAETLKNLLS